MKYFVDPYKKYYENLKDTSSMSSVETAISNAASSLTTQAASITSGVSSSTWKEMGASTVVTVIVPGLKALLGKLVNDISSTLKVAISKSTEIYTKASDLKKKDEELESKEKELTELKKEESKYTDDASKNTDEYKTWKSKVDSLDEEIKKLDADCKKLQTEMDTLASEINALEISSAESVEVAVGEGLDVEGVVGEIAPDGTFVTLNMGWSGNYNVVNTQGMSVRDFERFVIQNGLTQNCSEKYKNDCLGVAQAYGFWLTGHGRISANMEALMQTPTSTTKRTSPDKQVILGYIYDELVQGKPCVLKVSRKSGTGRHFATVVGMKDTVTSRDTIREEDLLIMDVYDGQIETMDGGPLSDRYMWNVDDGQYWMEALNYKEVARL